MSYLTQTAFPKWYKIILAVLSCILLGELVIIVWAIWAIFTIE